MLTWAPGAKITDQKLNSYWWSADDDNPGLGPSGTVDLGDGGTAVGRYHKVGTRVHWSVKVTFGADPSISELTVTLPTPALSLAGSTTGHDVVGTWAMFGLDGSTWAGVVAVPAGGDGSEAVFAGAWDGTSPSARIDGTHPIAPDTGVVLTASGVYEATSDD